MKISDYEAVSGVWGWDRLLLLLIPDVQLGRGKEYNLFESGSPPTSREM